MDKKDEIILQQLDVIRTMTQNNLNRMGSDFWGTPLTPDTPKSAVPKEARRLHRRGREKGRGSAASPAREDRGP